jgi:hypothetical protein
MKASGDGIPLFGFPKSTTTRKMWDSFVMTTRKDWELGQGTQHSQICAVHFCPSSFENEFKWVKGYTKCLRLIDTAVPTIKPSQVTVEQEKYFTNQAGTCGF